MISLVIPIFNEELLIDELYKRTMAAMQAITDDFEIICVDDGSSDTSLSQMVAYHQRDPRFKVLELSRNFGHQAALLAGMNFAQGDFIGVMDGDLQDPPEVFARFYAKLLEGYDVVYAVRKKRKEGILKKTSYWLYYRILVKISNMDLPLDSGDFSMIRRQVLQEMLRMPEQSLYLRGLRHWVGFKQAGVEYERADRLAGEPKYDFKKLMKLAYDGIFSFSSFPIKFMGRIGLLAIGTSITYAFYLLAKKIIWGEVPEGFTTLILAIFFFGGVQLVSIRIIGEYINRIYDESRGRPLFIVKNAFLASQATDSAKSE